MTCCNRNYFQQSLISEGIAIILIKDNQIPIKELIFAETIVIIFGINLDFIQVAW